MTFILIRISCIFLGALSSAFAQDVHLKSMQRSLAFDAPDSQHWQGNWTNAARGEATGDMLFNAMSEALIARVPFNEDMKKSTSAVSLDLHSESFASYYPGDASCDHANLSHCRVWAAAAKPVNYPRRSILAIKRTKTKNGIQEITNEGIESIIPANALESSFHDILDAFTIERAGALRQSESIQINLTLLPVEVSYVDRDVMTNQWAQKKSFASFTNAALFAGPHSGDMVEWRLPDGLFQNKTISWNANHIASGEITYGLSGVGVNFWRIADDGGNDPEQDEWLKWKPGEYMISCEWDGKTVEIQRVRVGYRSDHILVIGQIVPTFSHDLDKPIGGSAGLWASAVADDITSSILPAAAPLDFHDNWALGMGAAFLLQPERGAEAWAACWAGALGFPPGLIPGWWPSAWIPPPVAPPAVPIASAGPAFTSYGGKFRPMGTMTARHHYWATQHMLNTNPDTPTVPAAIFTKAAAGTPTLAQVFADKQYRVFHEFQAKFLLTNQGKIEQSTFVPIHNRAAKGTTKLKVGEVNAGDWGTAYASIGVGLPPISMPLPPFDIKPFPDEDSETNLHNERISHAAAGDEVSSFATARIGEKGRRVSYRQFGKDAPWIFSEIIFHVESDWKVNLMGRTSTTVQWDLLIKPDQSQSVIVSRSPYAPASTPGVSIFNNLNLYARSELDQFILIKDGLLNMEGHLQSFVESGSGAWPEPPIPPTVK